MAKLITGILAHVDAGKTTLSEALLYQSGAIRNIGRVDSKTSFLDNNSIEKERGITIFSKQAVLNEKITLIDTPGHIDFCAEMERTLQVLDVAILLINASDGIQSHTKTLWNLLSQYKIPTIIFVNKMDMANTNKLKLLSELKSNLCESIIDFENSYINTDSFFEELALNDESLEEKFLSEKAICNKDIQLAINKRNVFPCIFGSALKLNNIDLLLQTLLTYFTVPLYKENFGCIVYKISKDKQNNRLTHLKVTGGSLKVKDTLQEEKINEIRLYSGEKYDLVQEIKAGNICTVTGLKKSFAGKCYGEYSFISNYKTESPLVYSVIPPSDITTSQMLQVLKELEEELPEINVNYEQATKEIEIKLMGQVQTEVIKQLLQDRYKIKIDFGVGRIAYKETILESVVGVGHYEPLKHYAEVHLKLSPLPLGSGLRFISNLSVDVLDTNWQRLILTHLKEKTHIGILTGSPITDMQIEVIAGRSHLKHTEGGDFRQATYRALRNALMYSKSILLEPFYNYEIIVPQNCTGRVMNDIEKMHGTFVLNESKNDFSTLQGKVPVSTIKNYLTELRSFTKGLGTLNLNFEGYNLCHNQKEVIEQKNYNPNADLENPSGSVFCSHGAGFNVNWDEVKNFKHL